MATITGNPTNPEDSELRALKALEKMPLDNLIRMAELANSEVQRRMNPEQAETLKARAIPAKLESKPVPAPESKPEPVHKVLWRVARNGERIPVVSLSDAIEAHGLGVSLSNSL